MPRPEADPMPTQGLATSFPWGHSVTLGARNRKHLHCLPPQAKQRVPRPWSQTLDVQLGPLSTESQPLVLGRVTGRTPAPGLEGLLLCPREPGLAPSRTQVWSGPSLTPYKV